MRGFWGPCSSQSSLDALLCPQVDLGHLYGDNLQRQHQLRLFRDGKLKFQVPPSTTETHPSPVSQGCLKPMFLWHLLADPSPDALHGCWPGDNLWDAAAQLAAGIWGCMREVFPFHATLAGEQCGALGWAGFTGMFLSPPLSALSLRCPQVVDGEVYPPTVSEAPVHMVYPSGVPQERQLAVGQEVFGLLPGLCVYATLWLREHNRVCDLLKREHPTWSDEQLFQTARLILIGEELPPPCPTPCGPQGLPCWPASS